RIVLVRVQGVPDPGPVEDTGGRGGRPRLLLRCHRATLARPGRSVPGEGEVPPARVPQAVVEPDRQSAQHTGEDRHPPAPLVLPVVTGAVDDLTADHEAQYGT